MCMLRLNLTFLLFHFRLFKFHFHLSSFFFCSFSYFLRDLLGTGLWEALSRESSFCSFYSSLFSLFFLFSNLSQCLSRPFHQRYNLLFNVCSDNGTIEGYHYYSNLVSSLDSPNQVHHPTTLSHPSFSIFYLSKFCVSFPNSRN